MAHAARLSRVTRELELLHASPPPGVAAWPVSDANIYELRARKLRRPGTRSWLCSRHASPFRCPPVSQRASFHAPQHLTKSRQCAHVAENTTPA
jgi:hypothetical protein